jgi:precorrin-6A/cobalt-precorrin-6A reductase
MKRLQKRRIMVPNILVVAGIKEDARLIIEELLKMNFSITVAVTSRLGASWLKKYKGLTIKEGKLNLEVLSNIIEDTEVICLINVSQPSARDTSLNAMKACKRKGIRYLRFEATSYTHSGDDMIYVKSCNAAVKKLEYFQGNILLYVGIGKIEAFTAIPDFRNRVYVWAFPESSSIERYENLGLNAGHIIAVKGPVSEYLYIQMFKHCNVSVVVSKSYVNAAGDIDSISAAKKLGIPFIKIEKERLSYGNEANSINEVVKFVKNLKGS